MVCVVSENLDDIGQLVHEVGLGVRQRLAQVAFPQEFDEVGDVTCHVLAADVPRHAQLVQPRLFIEHLPLQFLMGQDDLGRAPFLFLTCDRRESYIIIFFIFFFYRGCGGKVFFFAFFYGFFLVFPCGRCEVLSLCRLDGVLAGAAALGAIGTQGGHTLHATDDGRAQQGKGDALARRLEHGFGILAAHTGHQGSHQACQLIVVEQGGHHLERGPINADVKGGVHGCTLVLIWFCQVSGCFYRHKGKHRLL